LKEKSIALLRALACAAILTALFAPSAAAGDWKVVSLGTPESHLHGVSCPTPNLCVAVGSPATYAVSSQPAGGAFAWTTSGHPQTGRADGYLRGVDCPSPSLCVAVEAAGTILTTTAPLAGADAWTEAPIPGGPLLTDISCPRTSRCVAVGEEGMVVTSDNPTAGPGAWTVERMAAPLPLSRVSCSAMNLACVATAGSAIVSTTNMMAGAASWELEGETAPSNQLNAVDCPTETFCAIGGTGWALTTASPTGPISGWTAASLPTGFQLLGIDCQSSGACLATTYNGEVFAAGSPAAAWVPGRFPGQPASGLFDVSCPSFDLCVAVGESSQVASSTDPFAVPAQAPPAEPARPPRPRTVIFGKHFRRLRLKGGKRKAGIRFHFTANGRFTGFQCKLDSQPFRRCNDAKSYALGLGRHVFKVRAVGPGGVDRSPGMIRVRVIEAQTPQPGPQRRSGPV